MGLIQAAKETVTTLLGDQWREYFYCDALPEDVLVSKGTKRSSGRSSNTKLSDNIISNGAIIAVNEGQCMMIVEQGQIVEFSAQAGEFTWDSSTEPSIFYGSLGENLKKSWETLKRRFTFGGDTAKDQRIYFFNLKEITANKYGTPNPIPFRVVDRNIGLDMDISLRCNGEYSYRVTDPLLFYKNVCGNVTDNYTRDRIDRQLKTEFITALQPALGKISAAGIRYSELPAHSMDIADAMNEVLTAKWSELRGISVVSVGISPSAAPEDEEKIKQMQRTAVYRNPGMAGAMLAGAQAEAMQNAAKNEGGAMLGFMGMNMAQNVGGLRADTLFQMDQQNAPAAAPAAPAAPTQDGWHCVCGAVNTGKFCTQCGAAKPADGWSCPKCGHVNKGKFCSECGEKKPAGAPLYRCDKCGWEPEDPKNPPKFCPECGDRFDENDQV